MSASDSRRTEDEIKKISSTSTTSVKMFLIFCAFRVVNVFFIQSQFDPDEYWQQLEPAYCRVFVGAGKPCPGLTWEWKRRPPSIDINLPSDFAEVGMKGPLRSYASILPTLLFYYAIKFFGLDSPWAVARGPVFLNAILVAAPTDWSVWNLSQWMSPQSTNKDHIASVARWCVFCALSSWFCAYALVRTYSNSLETLLLMISLCLVAPVRRTPLGDLFVPAF
jgi:phosphatidylinositol glycan class B